MKLHLLTIDPQYDFCNPNGALCVPGADQDINRLATMLNRLRKKIDKVHVTLDSHNEVDIAHPIFWVDSNGNHPDPFTIISADDVLNGVWTTTSPACRKRATEYVKELASNGRYPLCIWPTHCIIGTQGWTIQEPFATSLAEWCKTRFQKVNYVTKGSNPFTEHYSAVQADVPDPKDPTTMLNTDFINVLSEADEILISGQALSHCVANSVYDIANKFGDENISKFVLLEDTSSNVPGFEKFGEDFVRDMSARGMKVAKSDEYLA